MAQMPGIVSRETGDVEKAVAWAFSAYKIGQRLPAVEIKKEMRFVYATPPSVS